MTVLATESIYDRADAWRIRPADEGMTPEGLSYRLRQLRDCHFIGTFSEADVSDSPAGIDVELWPEGRDDEYGRYHPLSFSAFDHLCGMCGSPSDYLRSLPSTVVVQCLESSWEVHAVRAEQRFLCYGSPNGSAVVVGPVGAHLQANLADPFGGPDDMGCRIEGVRVSEHDYHFRSEFVARVLIPAIDTVFDTSGDFSMRVCSAGRGDLLGLRPPERDNGLVICGLPVLFSGPITEGLLDSLQTASRTRAASDEEQAVRVLHGRRKILRRAQAVAAVQRARALEWVRCDPLSELRIALAVASLAYDPATSMYADRQHGLQRAAGRVLTMHTQR